MTAGIVEHAVAHLQDIAGKQALVHGDVQDDFRGVIQLFDLRLDAVQIFFAEFMGAAQAGLDDAVIRKNSRLNSVAIACTCFLQQIVQQLIIILGGQIMFQKLFAHGACQCRSLCICFPQLVLALDLHSSLTGSHDLVGLLLRVGQQLLLSTSACFS